MKTEARRRFCRRCFVGAGPGERAACQPIGGDNIAHVVKWKDAADLAALAGRPVQLHIDLRAAKLYALQFTNDK